ncbi:MAG: VUT family protein [Actinomycetota bacterium]|nr:VUT family protein [Actinomycetota bacterium]
MNRFGIVAALVFVGTVFAANWAIERYGLVPVGFGLRAPAGVYFAGLAFALRDVVQETLGRRVVVGAILAGTAASYLVSPTFAVASGTAFLLSELADFAVYTPIRERTLAGGIAVSQAVGAAVDSALFLWLAFGSLAFFSGQFVGKMWMTLPALLAVGGWRMTRR